MNTYYFKTVFTILTVSLLFGISKAQDNIMESNCADVSAVQSIPTSGTIKALIIYVKFLNDVYENDLTGDWPHIINGHQDERPSWTEDMLTKTANGTDFEPSITGYYRSMSFNGLKLYGDVYPQGQEYPKLYVTQNNYEYYSSRYCHDPQLFPYDISTVVWEAITNLDNEIDYSQYDNNQDGFVDELIVWFRLGYFGNTDCRGYNGIARPTGYNHYDFIKDNGDRISQINTNDGVAIKYNSGLIADGPGRNGTAVMVHEIGHTMGFDHLWHVGLWNMMGARNGVGIMNTYERNNLTGWLPQGSITTINTQGVYNINLPDFETTGKTVIIQTQSGTYTLENRSGNSFYSKAGNWVMPGNGLLITRDNYTTVECADHKWNYVRNLGGSCSDCNNSYTFEIQNGVWQRNEPSNTGVLTLDLLGVCTNLGCGTHPNSGGAAGNVFSVDYNQVFSYWSNTNADLATNGQPIVIDLISKQSDSSMNINIYYGLSNAYVNTHPSKPLYLRCSQNNFDPNDIYKFHPKLTWFRNTEPDMSSNAFYKIFRADMTDNQQYVEIATISAPGSGTYVTYIDESFTLWDPGTPGEGVCRRWKNLVYKVQAIDNEELRSVYSDPDKIEGFQDPCSVVEGDNFISDNIPKDYSIYNYPNPFNPTTDIKFSLPKDEIVTIKVYNLLGEEITTLVNSAYRTAGNYSVKFNGSNLASGVYFYTIEAGTYMVTKKMVLIK